MLNRPWLMLCATLLVLTACTQNDPSPAPSGLTVTPENGQIVLRWSDNSDTEGGYAVYRQVVTDSQALSAQANTVSQESLTRIAKLPENTTTFTDEDVEANTLYRYGVSVADFYIPRSAQISSEPVGLAEAPAPTPTPTPNAAPTDITLDSNTVEENQPAGTTVGTLSATDADSSSFTYSLVAGEGDTDNASFSVEGEQLQTAAAFDFETKSEYSVRIQVSDGDASFAKSFTINVTDVDDENPSVTFSDDNPSELTLNQEVTFTGTAEDNVGVSTLALFEVKNDTETKLDDLTLDTNGSWSYAYTPNKAGDVTLKVVATDEAGNEAEDEQEVFVTGTTRTGDVTVTDQAGLDALANVSTVTGTFTITSDAELDFSPLNALKEVGNLELNDNANITDISGFKNLTRINRYLQIINNSKLTSIPSFESLEQIEVIDIDGNLELTNIDSFSQVTDLDLLYITSNPKLISISGFDKLTSNGVFNSEVRGNTQLDCPAQNLTFAPVRESFGNLVDCPPFN